LHAGSGERYSIRVASSLPGLYCGTHQCRAVAPGPAHVDRRLEPGDQPLIGVHPLVRY
jgi:hypothetical protein